VTQLDMPPSARLQTTPFCRALSLTAPVVQAPVGSASTAELAAAVSNAGGLGMLALTWTPPGSVRERIRATRALTDRPFGVNVVLEWDQHERVRACAKESVAVVSTFWGDPRPYVDTIHAGGALHLHTVGCAEEARRAYARRRSDGRHGSSLSQGARQT
jgi:nitronate monooxygenase